MFEPASYEPLAGPGCRRGLLAAVVIGAVVLRLAGLAALADRGGADETELLPGPTTVPVVPTTAVSAPPVALTVPPNAPPTMAPPDPAPPPERDKGTRNGDGNGRHDKPKDD